MNVILLSSSPNTDGLTAACVEAAAGGAETALAQASRRDLTREQVGRCSQCGNGWGTCRDEHLCQVHDGFQDLHAAVNEADGVVLVTPVYWGEASESMKAFLDRLRRCEALRGDSPLKGRPFMLVAAAGGGGGGVSTCLDQLERFCNHVGARRHDLLGVTRATRGTALPAIENSAREMVTRHLSGAVDGGRTE
ncbi:MAG: flavodoxin family protein [Spirochaetota bacterium]